MADAKAVAEETARASYGRLLAAIAVRARNIATAEDALADAFAAALEAWPRSGVPDSPEAWLLTAARRKLIDSARREATRVKSEPDLIMMLEEVAGAIEQNAFVDERLKLLFVCAHPAIAADVRTPLMLQAVLGLDAARIASAFLVAPAAMGQRLVRAKRKIVDAGVSFEAPSPEDLPERMSAVLEAVYAAFGAGYDSHGADARGADLAEEAIYLGGLLTRLAPGCAEAHGLYALMSFVHARAAARRAGNAYVPLTEQSISLWDHHAIEVAEMALAAAWRLGAPGRFQYEAAIQSAHCAARRSGADTRDAVLTLYDRLVETAPSAGAHTGRAAALLAAGRTADALAALNSLDADLIARYQPYWATRAHVLADAGETSGAAKAFDRAIALAEDGAARSFLLGKRAALGI